MVLNGVRNGISGLHCELANIVDNWHVPSISIVPKGEDVIFSPVFYVKDAFFQMYCVRAVEWGDHYYMDFHFQHRDNTPELVQMIYGPSNDANEERAGGRS